MPSQEFDHCLITSSLPRSHHAQIGRLSRSGSALTASINSTGTSIDVPDPRQFAKYATKSVDGKPRRHPPRVLLLKSACWHRAIHRSAERSSPLAIAPSALKRNPASCGVGSRLAAAMQSSAAKKAFLFRELNCAGQDMVPSGSRNTHTRCLNLPATARRKRCQWYKQAVSTGLPSRGAATAACAPALQAKS